MCGRSQEVSAKLAVSVGVSLACAACHSCSHHLAVCFLCEMTYQQISANKPSLQHTMLSHALSNQRGMGTLNIEHII